MTDFDEYIQVYHQDYEDLFENIAHTNSIEGIDVALHFKYIKFDPNGNPKTDLLIEILFSYFTHYCFSAQKRHRDDMTDQEYERHISKLKDEARKLFRKWYAEEITEKNQPKSGEMGEMILWLFMEIVLKAPQIVAKMDLKTNRKLEVFGSDGIHVNINSDVLQIYFGEAKLYGSITQALTSAFTSIEKFHEDKMHEHEYNLITTHFKFLSDAKQKQVKDFVSRRIEAHEVKIKHACLIGYDWNEYQKLNTEQRNDFIANFTTLYSEETKRLTELIQKRFDAFSRKEFSFDVFFIPFKSVQELRTEFNKKL